MKSSTTRRGVRAGDLALGVGLASVGLSVLSEPNTQCSPMLLTRLWGTTQSTADPTLWLTPLVVTSVVGVLVALTIVPRLFLGRKRIFLAGAAVGGWAFFLLTIPGWTWGDSLLRMNFAGGRIVSAVDRPFTDWLLRRPSSGIFGFFT